MRRVQREAPEAEPEPEEELAELGPDVSGREGRDPGRKLLGGVVSGASGLRRPNPGGSNPKRFWYSGSRQPWMSNFEKLSKM